MEPEKKDEPTTENKPLEVEDAAPADALSRTPEDLEKEEADRASNDIDASSAAKRPLKKVRHSSAFYAK